MVCLACRAWSRTALCDACAATLRPAPDAHVGFVVRPALAHIGAGRVLVLRLKYEGVPAAGRVLAAAMVARLPPGARTLVPIPRSLPRRVRFGVDPGRTLAGAMGRMTGLPVADLLRPEWWHRPNAGQSRGLRRVPRFDVVRQPPPGTVIVDDVLTTGATLVAAHGVLGPNVVGAVTATRSLPRHRAEGAVAAEGILPSHGLAHRDE